MAYEEKRNSAAATEEENFMIPILKFMRQLLSKWYLIVAFVVVFTVAGFGIAKATYTEQYDSTVYFNVSNKDRDIAGAAGTYTTSSDTQASITIANNFKTLIQNGNDFITDIQEIVEASTGVKYEKTQLRGMISVEVVQDTTLIQIKVKSTDEELAYALSTAIQSVYPEIAKDVFPTANISVADNATKATLSSDSSAILYSAIGFILGGVIAVAIILVSALIQNKVMSPDDIKNKFNVEIIASVSDIKTKKKNEVKKLLITDKNVGLPFIETFKLIRTKIESAKLKKGYSVYAITSSTESEGKTTCSVNTALSLAKSGKSVLLIDADLRKPAVCKTIGVNIGDEKGIYDIVTGARKFEDAVKYIDKLNLYLLASPTPVEDPSETLASDKMAEIIAEARKNFDYVIVDCPPAGVVADATIVGNYVDTIIFVTAEEKVSISQVEYALSDLMTSKAEILGCIYNHAGSTVLSSFSEKAGGYYGAGSNYYGSSYYYGSRSSYYGSYGSYHSKKKKNR